MDFLDIAKNRYSVRKFSERIIEEEKIEKILEAAKISPTACNNSPQVIYVLKSKEAIEKLQKCKYSHFGETLAFIIGYDKTKCWVREFDNKDSGEVDASIVTTHMMLEASSLGIGSTWVMHYIPEALRKEFNIPDNFVDTAILVMGYPNVDASPSKSHFEKKEFFVEEL